MNTKRFPETEGKQKTHLPPPAPRVRCCQLSCFVGNPGILMYGMMCVLYTTAMWLLVACYLELPVSTTHATVGGVVGMAVAFGGGSNCIIW